MFYDNSMLEPEFSAVLSNKAMEDGELKHANIESLRKVCMAAGLTNSSQKLKDVCNSNPKEFQDALEFGLESFEHYQNLLLLLENSILRIYAVAVNSPTWDGGESIENLEERITKILSSKSQGNQQ